MNLNFNEIVKSKTFRGFIIGLGTFLVLVIVFQAGVFMGFRKANFSQHLGENYGRIFGEERREGLMGRMFEGLPFDNLPGSHGAVGQVIKVSSSTLVVAEPNNIEKIVILSDDTLIRKARGEITTTNIVVGDFVSVIGEANSQAEIVAKLIRVMPAPFASSTLKK